ncbi:MAG: hypothetical protein K1Y36_10315 [Blastocatellia bacterium]|nr:hypothetical protein [Blastocatellia bacterium]
MGRAAVNKVFQIGVETTAGTAVAAGKQLPSLSFSLSPELRTKDYRANGFKTTTVLQLNREMAKGSVEGPLTYNEIIWLLCGLIGENDGSVGGSAPYTWDFAPKTSGADTPKTFTVEVGDSTAAQQAAYTQFKNFKLSASKDEVKVSGDLFARSLANISNLTATPTVIDQLPVNVNEIDVFIDSTFGGIGGTKLTDVMMFDIEIGDKFLAREVLNTTFQSFKDAIETDYQVKVSFVVEFNAQTQALYAAMKASGLPTRYIRFKATGPTLGAGTYLFQFDAAVKLMATEQTDQDGVYAYKFECLAIHDSSFGGAYSFQVKNNVSAL